MEISNTKFKYPSAKQIIITDIFWKKIIERTSDVTLKDILIKFEKDGISENFKSVIKGETLASRNTSPWYDGLLYEVIRGTSDFLAYRYDAEIDKMLDGYISLIAEAQSKDKDGYINTYTTLVCPEHRFGIKGGSLLWLHDLYNIGCLAEAGVHHYIATGKTTLLSCSVKAANYVSSIIGYPPKMNIVPAHSMAEAAFVKLYKLFSANKELSETLGARPDDYLITACFWIDFRGVHNGRASMPKHMREYAQDHTPLRQQDEAVGHAVRAALLYTGLAAVANETGDGELASVSRKLWENVNEKKIHITGGIGALHSEESFGYQYQLPENAYLETCAGVALCFWAGEMNLLFEDGKIFDTFEKALYNNVLSSVSEDGKKYFYENPLVSDGSIERWDWHSCPCCPPMFIKMMGALPTYVFSYSENTLSVNLHVGAKIETEYFSAEYVENDGAYTLSVKGRESGRIAVRIRIPEYCDGFGLALNGKKITFEQKNGFAVVDREWSPEDRLMVTFDTAILRMEAHPFACSDPERGGVLKGLSDFSGKTAIQKGAVIYCAEGVDNGGDVDFVLSDGPLHEDDGMITGTDVNGRTVRFMPYYKWCNRGGFQMKIWINREKSSKLPPDSPEWQHRLYRAWRKD